ncbi:MAG: PAS domain S-box protein [Gammaproteobacteria bacterium]|nr:PAS domain S-box protein [Gammaproteobacteria bacterium]
MPSHSIPDSLDAFKAIVEYSPDITTIVNMDVRVVFQSRAVSTLGYERDELTGQNVIDYLHPDDRAKVKTALGTCA